LNAQFKKLLHFNFLTYVLKAQSGIYLNKKTTLMQNY